MARPPRKTAPKTTFRVCLRLDPDVAAALQDLARVSGLPVRRVLRLVCQEMLSRRVRQVLEEA